MKTRTLTFEDTYCLAAMCLVGTGHWLTAICVVALMLFDINIRKSPEKWELDK